MKGLRAEDHPVENSVSNSQGEIETCTVYLEQGLRGCYSVNVGARGPQEAAASQ